MNEFKDQLDATEKEKVAKLVTELRELAVKGQAADATVTADAIREKINETQQASLGLFQKVSNGCFRCEDDAESLLRSMKNGTLRTRRKTSHQSQQRKRRKRRRIRPFLPGFRLIPRILPLTNLALTVASLVPMQIDHIKVRLAIIIHYNIIYLFIHSAHPSLRSCHFEYQHNGFMQSTGRTVAIYSNWKFYLVEEQYSLDFHVPGLFR